MALRRIRRCLVISLERLMTMRTRFDDYFSGRWCDGVNRPPCNAHLLSDRAQPCLSSRLGQTVYSQIRETANDRRFGSAFWCPAILLGRFVLNLKQRQLALLGKNEIGLFGAFARPSAGFDAFPCFAGSGGADFVRMIVEWYWIHGCWLIQCELRLHGSSFRQMPTSAMRAWVCV